MSMKKPSLRIKELVSLKLNGLAVNASDYQRITAIMEYLDEDYEKKLVEKRKREETGERF